MNNYRHLETIKWAILCDFVELAEGVRATNKLLMHLPGWVWRGLFWLLCAVQPWRDHWMRALLLGIEHEYEHE